MPVGAHMNVCVTSNNGHEEIVSKRVKYFVEVQAQNLQSSVRVKIPTWNKVAVSLTKTPGLEKPRFLRKVLGFWFLKFLKKFLRS